MIGALRLSLNTIFDAIALASRNNTGPLPGGVVGGVSVEVGVVVNSVHLLRQASAQDTP